MKYFYSQDQKRGHNAGLRMRIVLVLLVVSLLPLSAVFVGAAVVFSQIIMAQSISQKKNSVAGHAAALDIYLKERSRVLEIAANSYPVEALCSQTGLQSLFDVLGNADPSAFQDLGVIDERGNHLAYIGPYTLTDKNYRQSEWFKETLSRGATISDVFLGFRAVPHIVIAVPRREGDKRFILRATINNDTLSALVRQIDRGATGDAFVVNREGIYQTAPKEGSVLERSGLIQKKTHSGVLVKHITVDRVQTVQATTWLNHDHWLLVVRQAESEIMAPAHNAIITGSLVALIGVLLIMTTTWLATSYLTNRIDQAVSERDALSRDLMRSAKLASLGELATGLAHEINNPLAVMSAEHTNISDVAVELRQTDGEPGCLEKITDSVDRCRRQVERCRGVTMKMLQFGRHSERRLDLVDIGPLLEECVGLMKRQIDTEKIAIHLEIAADVPQLFLDGNELEQVLVNLLTNAIQAVSETGDIFVTVKRVGNMVEIVVEDTGSGIPKEALEHIFQPFYTTKPVGVGTGLGLAVCHGIVRSFNGNIEVSSEEGKGTAVVVRLPVPTLRREHRFRSKKEMPQGKTSFTKRYI